MSERVAVLRKGLTSVGVLIAFWLLLFASARVFEAFAARELIQALATATALALAMFLRVRLVAFFLAAMLAFNVSELVIHSIWTAGAVRGGPTHFAVMGAGVLGVALGVLVDRLARR